MRGRAGREPGVWGAPRCRCGASAGPKRSEVSIRPGTGQGARVSILPQEGVQGAACPRPGGGRARQARHLRAAGERGPRHTCGRSRPRGEVTRDGSQGRGNGAVRALRPPPSWEGEQPRRGLPREIKNRERMAPQSRSWAFTRKNRDQDRLLPEFPAAAAQCPTCERHPRMKTTRRGVPVDLAFASVYLLLPTRHELGASRLKKQRLVSPRKTRLVLHCRTICVYTPGLLSPQSHENAIVTSL